MVQSTTNIAGNEVDMQFLNPRVVSGSLRRINQNRFLPQSEAAMTNFKFLLLLEISLLHRGICDWSPALTGSVAEGKIQGAAGQADGDNKSSNKQVSVYVALMAFH
jgi:hypothetical protein